MLSVQQFNSKMGIKIDFAMNLVYIVKFKINCIFILSLLYYFLVQVIKAFRVLATDILTLVVEVQSDPPAIFEWFCNDRPVQQNRRKFKVLIVLVFLEIIDKYFCNTHNCNMNKSIY